MSLDRRLDNLQQAMGKAGVDLAIFGASPSYQYLTRSQPAWRESRDHTSPWCIVVAPGRGETVVVAPSEAQAPKHWPAAKKICKDKAEMVAILSQMGKSLGSTKARIALDDELKGEIWAATFAAFANPAISSASHLLDQSRMIKETDEINKLRQAGVLTDNAIRGSLSSIRRGITMRDLQLEIEYQGRKLGASGISFHPVSGFIAESGRPTGSIFSYDDDEELRSDTTIFFDVGFVFDGYCSDWGRSIYFGSPPREESEAYAALGRAVEEAVASLRPGKTRVCDIYDLIETSLDGDGFGDLIRARLPNKSVGHQIGVEVHENPWLEPGYNEVLEQGMVMCLEPKLWKDGSFYLRIEDMVLITEHGAEFLTNFDHRFFVLP